MGKTFTSQKPSKVKKISQKTKIPRQSLIKWGILLLILPLFTLNAFIVIHILGLGIRGAYKLLLIVSFISPMIYFIWHTISKKLNQKESTSDLSELIYTRTMNNFTLFLLLFTFYATFFIGLLIFRERSPEGEIPFLRDGTIGMRSWQSKVIIKKIMIHYHDSLGIWQQIPEQMIYDSNNWTKVSWHRDKLKDQIDFLTNRTLLQELLHKQNITVGDKIDSYIKRNINFKDSSFFMLQNCALIYTPQGQCQKIFHDFRIDCNVTIEKINEPVDELYPGFQLLSFVDTNKVYNENGIKEFSELCFQFNLGMNNNHIPWIPGLDYEPPTKFVSAINKMKKFGDYNNMQVDKEYSISAIVIKDKVLFLGNTGGSVKLFEAQLSLDKYPVQDKKKHKM